MLWYYASPFVAVMLAGLILMSVWKVWLEGRGRDFAPAKGPGHRRWRGPSPGRPTIAGDTTFERGGWQACGTVPQDQDEFGIRSCPKNGTESWRWRCCFRSGPHEK